MLNQALHDPQFCEKLVSRVKLCSIVVNTSHLLAENLDLEEMAGLYQQNQITIKSVLCEGDIACWFLLPFKFHL